MRSLNVRSIADFVNVVQEHCGGINYLFRGHRRGAPLVPRLGRRTARADGIEAAERALVADFQREAVPHLEAVPTNDWDWIAVAQHFGLPTRLLDWTTNALTALWFAVHRPAQEMEDGKRAAAAVYAYAFQEEDVLPHAQRFEKSPFDNERVWVFRPTNIARRISVQGSWFMTCKIENGKFRPIEDIPRFEERLLRITVEPEYFPAMRLYLDRLGVNAATLFPDLDSVTRYLEWVHTTLPDE